MTITSPRGNDTLIRFRSKWSGDIALVINDEPALIAIHELKHHRSWSLKLMRLADLHGLLTQQELDTWRPVLDGTARVPMILGDDLEKAYHRIIEEHVRVTINDDRMTRQTAEIAAGAVVVISLSTDLSRSWAKKWTVFRGRSRREIDLN